MTTAQTTEDIIERTDNLREVRDALLQASISINRAITYARSIDSNDLIGIDGLVEAMQKVSFSSGYFWAKESK